MIYFYIHYKFSSIILNSLLYGNIFYVTFNHIMYVLIYIIRIFLYNH